LLMISKLKIAMPSKLSSLLNVKSLGSLRTEACVEFITILKFGR
jgi:hypothetical protein